MTHSIVVRAIFEKLADVFRTKWAQEFQGEKFHKLLKNFRVLGACDIAHSRVFIFLQGNFWGIGGLPDEMGGLINLRVFDLQGIPSANTFLWDDEARARHGEFRIMI